jgi:hypothetical protein
VATRKYKVEEKDDGGRIYHLRNDVRLQVDASRNDQVAVLMWREAPDTEKAEPDGGDLYKSGFRNKYIERNAPRIFADVQPKTEDAEEERKANAERWKTCLSELREDLENIAVLLRTSTVAGQSILQQMAAASKKKRDVTERLLRYGRNGATYYHTPDRQPFAAVKVADHHEHYRVTDEEFSDWLEQEYWTGEEQRLAAQNTGALQPVSGQEPLPDVVRDRDLADAIRSLRGLARFKGEEHEVYRRVTRHEGKVYIDICDEEWRIIEVDADDWRIIAGDEAPVRFSRKPGMLAMTEPVKGGTLQPLRDLLHLGEMGEGKQGERNWRLIVPWLVQALSPDGAYGILTIIGTNGSGKTDLQWILRYLTDPNTHPLRGKPEGVTDLFIAANNSWLVSLENMDKVPPWLSDALCMICTMGSYGLRKKYSDDRETLFNSRRPIVVNGIGDILQHADLLDRAAIVRVPTLSGTGKRRDDDLVFDRAKEIAPGVLGALLELLSNYLKVKDDLGYPDTRMISYARIGIACSKKLGWNTEEVPEAFLSAYTESKLDATSIVLEKYPVVAVLSRFAETWSKDDQYEGTAQELYAELNKMAGDHLKQSENWPAGAAQLGQQLNSIEGELRKVGVVVEQKTVHGTRYRRVYKDGQRS